MSDTSRGRYGARTLVLGSVGGIVGELSRLSLANSTLKMVAMVVMVLFWRAEMTEKVPPSAHVGREQAASEADIRRSRSPSS